MDHKRLKTVELVRLWGTGCAGFLLAAVLFSKRGIIWVDAGFLPILQATSGALAAIAATSVIVASYLQARRREAFEKQQALESIEPILMHVANSIAVRSAHFVNAIHRDGAIIIGADGANMPPANAHTARRRFAHLVHNYLPSTEPYLVEIAANLGRASSDVARDLLVADEQMRDGIRHQASSLVRSRVLPTTELVDDWNRVAALVVFKSLTAQLVLSLQTNPGKPAATTLENPIDEVCEAIRIAANCSRIDKIQQLVNWLGPVSTTRWNSVYREAVVNGPIRFH